MEAKGVYPMLETVFLPKPAQLEAKLQQWLAHPNAAGKMHVEYETAYSGHKVYAITLTDTSIPNENKNRVYISQPHAHEPATTAGMMDVIEQLVTGKDLSGNPTQLDLEKVLQTTLLTINPIGNPYGTERAPYLYWDGSNVTNEQFWCIMFGEDPNEPGKRWNRVDIFDTREVQAPDPIGIAYEPIDEFRYVEPNRSQLSSFSKLFRRMQQKHKYQYWIDLHQTEFVNSLTECTILLPNPTLQTEATEASSSQWAEEISEAWRQAGYHVYPPKPSGYTGVQLEYFRRNWSDVYQTMSKVTIEVKNNSPQTSPERQMKAEAISIMATIQMLSNSSNERSPTMPSTKPKAYILPFGAGLDRVCSPEARNFIEENFDAVWNETNASYSKEQLSQIVEDAEIILTSWGSPGITKEMLTNAPRLRYVGHAAGTVKGIVPKEIFGHGVKVFSAAPRIAQSVGEFCLAALMTMLRKIPQNIKAVQRGEWWDFPERHSGRELTGQTVGIVSASSTARYFIQLLAPFRTNILLFDPYLSEENAQKLGVKLASLEEVMSCPIISIHAPSIPATENLIHADLIRSINDGAILINSSRGVVLDEEVLLSELQTGRFYAALDVFKKEPPEKDSPFLQLDNVLVTPHIAGSTRECFQSLLLEVARDIQRSKNEEPTRYEIYERMWEFLA